MSQPDETAPRRLYLISLRVLMLVVLIVAGWVGWRVNRAHVQRRAVARIVRAGGTIRYDYEFDGTLPYKTATAPPVPAWQRQTIGDEYFQEVTLVVLVGGNEQLLTDADLAAVAGLDRLLEFHVGDSGEITDAGMVHLAGLRRLRNLSLWNMPRITDASLAHLAGMTDLHKLCLFGCDGFTDAGLRAHLSRHTGLRELGLTGRQLTGAGLACLEPLKDLRSLRLADFGKIDTGLFDEDLAHLSGLTELRELDLSFNERITAAGLRHLRGLKKLRKLALDGTWVSDDAIADLKAALPGLAVSRVGRPFWCSRVRGSSSSPNPSAAAGTPPG